MKYTKKALSFKDQAQLLISRGMIVSNPVELEEYLKQVNYYRLSGYWYNFKIIDSKTRSECFKPGTTFELIREHYDFDSELRLLLMDALEKIEVSILRTKFVEAHTKLYGPFGYTHYRNYNPQFPKVNLEEPDRPNFQKLMNNIKNDEERSYQEFITRYRHKYNLEEYLPLWMVVELMSFGQLVTLYRNQHLTFKRTIASQFDLSSPVMDSWLLTLNTVRNDCAHHNRLWNRPLPNRPKIPDRKSDIRWHFPNAVKNDQIYIVLTVIQYLLAFINPANTWKNSIANLLNAYPNIPRRFMGIPNNWQDSPLWK